MEITDALVATLSEKAKENRQIIVDVFKGGGHFGGSFSCTDILTVLYNSVMNVDPANPKWEDRDYFILSKGHANGALATALATRGFYSCKQLDTFNCLDSPFGEHPTQKMPGVEIPTGSLGHGLSIGVGIALSLKLDKKDSKVYVLMGDGELHEGQVWEAMQAAAKWGLDNLIAIVDRNRLSMDGPTESVSIPLEPLIDKWSSFNWAVKTVNGHDVRALLEVFSGIPFSTGSPSVIIANTVKGKGVSFMEGDYNWHYGLLNEETRRQALNEIGEVR